MDQSELAWLVEHMRKDGYRFDHADWEFVPEDPEGGPQRLPLSVQGAWESVRGVMDRSDELGQGVDR